MQSYHAYSLSVLSLKVKSSAIVSFSTGVLSSRCTETEFLVITIPYKYLGRTIGLGYPVEPLPYFLQIPCVVEISVRRRQNAATRPVKSETVAGTVRITPVMNTVRP